jgi:hypothetical protein
METLALIEALDRDGHPRQVLRVAQWPVRIGRAIDCDLVLDDPHVAALHATLDWREDGLHVTPAASVNGVRLGASVIAPGAAPLVPPSGLLVMGATSLRVRLAGDVLAPEQRFIDFHKVERRHAIQLAVLIAIAALWEGFVQWLTTAPGSPGSTLAMSYLGKPAMLVLWCAAWAIGSMLFQHRFAFWAHLRVALTWLLLGALTEAAAAQVAFARRREARSHRVRRCDRDDAVAPHGPAAAAAAPRIRHRDRGRRRGRRLPAAGRALGGAGAAGRRPVPRHDLAARRARGQDRVDRRLREVGRIAREDAVALGQARGR